MRSSGSPFQGFQAGGEGLTLPPQRERHVFQRLEFLPRHKLEIVCHALGLGTYHSAHFVANALGRSGCVSHQFGELIHPAVFALHLGAALSLPHLCHIGLPCPRCNG